MAQAKAKTATKVRPDSRVGLAVKALLDSGDLNPVPACYLEYLGDEWALVSPEGLMQWAKAQGMDIRPHDLEEMKHCLQVLYVSKEMLSEGDTRGPYVEALSTARGLWTAATGYVHDFDDDGLEDWKGGLSPYDVELDIRKTRARAEKVRKEVVWKVKQADEFEVRAAKGTDKYDVEQAPLRRAEAIRAADELAREDRQLASLEALLGEVREAAAKKPRLQ